MVRGRLDGSMRKSTDGRGGLRRSPADSKKVVLGGAERRSRSSCSASPVVALPPAFFGEDGCLLIVGVELSLLSLTLSV